MGYSKAFPNDEHSFKEACGRRKKIFYIKNFSNNNGLF